MTTASVIMPPRKKSAPVNEPVSLTYDERAGARPEPELRRLPRRKGCPDGAIFMGQSTNLGRVPEFASSRVPVNVPVPDGS